jgi:ribosomal protein S4
MVQGIEGKVIPGWLSLDIEKGVGRVVSPPTPSDIESKFELHAVVEYYSR